MKSTGEVMGSHEVAAAAYLKARMATEVPVPISGGVYITVRDSDKTDVIPHATRLQEMGFTLHATPGTAQVLRDKGGLEVEAAYRIAERKSPDALDLMRQGDIQLILNTPLSQVGLLSMET